MIKTMNALRMVIMVAGAAIIAFEPALAGSPQPGVPAPLLGAGIPGLVAFAGGYWAIRKRRKG